MKKLGTHTSKRRKDADYKYPKQRDHFQLGCSENTSQLCGISGEPWVMGF